MKYLLVFFSLTSCVVKKEETHIHPCVVAPPRASQIEQVLINGEIANPKDWPTIFKTVQGSASCTGTVIGPKVLQLAAHCVGDGKNSVIEVAGSKMSAKCTHHSGYKSDATADYALCLFDKELDLPWYETITDQEAKIGDDLLLTGMGCTQQNGGPVDWKLRIGKAEVVELPTDDNDIVTKGGAALCFGDSSSSAFMKVGDQYKIAAINSRSDLIEYSYLPAVYTDTAKEFYAKWAADNKVDICGITKDAKLCRGSEPIPPPPGPNPPGPQPECPK